MKNCLQGFAWVALAFAVMLSSRQDPGRRVVEAEELRIVHEGKVVVTLMGRGDGAELTLFAAGQPAFRVATGQGATIEVMAPGSKARWFAECRENLVTEGIVTGEDIWKESIVAQLTKKKEFWEALLSVGGTRGAMSLAASDNLESIDVMSEGAGRASMTLNGSGQLSVKSTNVNAISVALDLAANHLVDVLFNRSGITAKASSGRAQAEWKLPVRK